MRLSKNCKPIGLFCKEIILRSLLTRTTNRFLDSFLDLLCGYIDTHTRTKRIFHAGYYF